MAEHNRILVGVIGAPHGVRGELRVKSYTAVPAAIATYHPLTTEDGRTSFRLLGVRPVKDDMVVARFEGVTTREAAAALTNTRLYVDRAVLPPPEEEEFYQADLIGLQAETEAGAAVGRVIALQNFGASDLVEIDPGQGATLLVPFTKAFVPVVDVAGGRIVVTEAALRPEEPDEEAEEPTGPAPH